MAIVLRMSVDENSDTFFDGHWMREATLGESFFEEHHLKAHFLTCYRLNLKSKSPLKEEDVRLALTYLYRKCPSLQFCFGMKDGKNWIRRSTNPEIDFQVHHGKELREVRECLQSYRYKSNTGPLFCARLLLDCPDPPLDADDLEPPSFHGSILLFGLHHGISDGTTNMYIMKFFVSLLNDVILKKPIDVDEPLGVLVGNDYIGEEIGEKIAMLRGDQSLREKMAQKIERSDSHSPYIITAFPRPNERCMTHSYEFVVDLDTTARFFKKCREEKVTINSGFSAAANVALVDLVRESGVASDSYVLQNAHLVNLRRYWKKPIPNALGVHMGFPLIILTEVPGKVGSNYWDYARAMHSHISRDLQEKSSLYDQAYQIVADYQMGMPSADFKSFTTDYTISNMGDVTPLATEGGEEVRITHITRSTSNHLVDKCPVSIICHTFRGKFTMTFDYNAAALERDFILRYCRQIVKRMQDVE